MTYKVVIVEDEKVSRQALTKMIDEIPWLKIVGEAANVRNAVDLINDNEPDVLFLDIKLPRGTGLDILDQVIQVPHIIFTTAYGKFAVDAFDYRAVDYLLKPFSRRRFDEAIEKLSDRLFNPADEIKIFMKSGNKVTPISLAQVEYFQADRDYVVAYCAGEERLLSTTLKMLENQLDSGRYIKIHRSLIVNVYMIKSMTRCVDRRIRLIMRGGNEIYSSRTGAKLLRNLVR